MTPKSYHRIIFLIVALSAPGQPTVDTSKKTLFENGIYLENLNITLPWHFQLGNQILLAYLNIIQH